jgi:hypothetical protein
MAELSSVVLDLGSSPLANSNLSDSMLNQMEARYPLIIYRCDDCSLVQLDEFEAPAAIFEDYVYFSSYSDSWLAHAKKYVDDRIKDRDLDESSMVVEIASNDGYLLQYFKEQGVPVHGVEPAKNVAEYALEKGIPTTVKFFGEQTARELVEEGIKANLSAANNVLAHVPDINDFVTGFKVLLAENGLVNVEFPHLYELVRHVQYDTIYHEHFSYLSLGAVSNIFAAKGLKIFDVEQLTTHGGSLRIYASHEFDAPAETDRYKAVMSLEDDFGITDGVAFANFRDKVLATKMELLTFLIEQRKAGKTVVGYGAPAKGNTLLNFCGVGKEFIEYTVDRNPHKQNLYLPGTRIPIYAPEKIMETKPDFVLILPWNLQAEVAEQMKEIREWGGKFVIPIPEVRVI